MNGTLFCIEIFYRNLRIIILYIFVVDDICTTRLPVSFLNLYATTYTESINIFEFPHHLRYIYDKHLTINNLALGYHLFLRSSTKLSQKNSTGNDSNGDKKNSPQHFCSTASHTLLRLSFSVSARESHACLKNEINIF